MSIYGTKIATNIPKAPDVRPKIMNVLSTHLIRNSTRQKAQHA
jgi:hypothetical protein